MRVSVRKNDPGYRKNTYNVKIFLDGKEVRDCFTADDKTGEAFCYERNGEGLLVKAEDGQSIKEITRKGIVQIVFPLLERGEK